MPAGASLSRLGGGKSRSSSKKISPAVKSDKVLTPDERHVEPKEPVLDPYAVTPSAWASTKKYLSEFWGLTGSCGAHHPSRSEARAFCVVLGSPEPPVEWSEFWSSRTSKELRFFTRSVKWRVKVPWELGSSMPFDNNHDKQILQLNFQRNQQVADIHRCNIVPTVIIFAIEERAQVYDKQGWHGAWRKEAGLTQTQPKVSGIPNKHPQWPSVLAGYGHPDDRQYLITTLDRSWIGSNSSWVPYTSKTNPCRVSVGRLMLKELNDLVHITYHFRKNPGRFGSLDSLWHEQGWAWGACGDIWNHLSSGLIRAKCEEPDFTKARHRSQSGAKPAVSCRVPHAASISRPTPKSDALFFFKQGLDNRKTEFPADAQQMNHQDAASTGHTPKHTPATGRQKLGNPQGGDLAGFGADSTSLATSPSRNGLNYNKHASPSCSTVKSVQAQGVKSPEEKPTNVAGVARHAVIVVDLTEDHQRNISASRASQDRQIPSCSQGKQQISRDSDRGSWIGGEAHPSANSASLPPTSVEDLNKRQHGAAAPELVEVLNSSKQPQQAERLTLAKRNDTHRPLLTTSNNDEIRTDHTGSDGTVVLQAGIEMQPQKIPEYGPPQTSIPASDQALASHPQQGLEALGLESNDPETVNDTRKVLFNENTFWAELYFCADQKPPPPWVTTFMPTNFSPQLFLLPWARRNPHLMRIGKSSRWRAQKQIEIDARPRWKEWRGKAKKHERIRWSEKEALKLRVVERPKSVGILRWMKGKLCQHLMSMEIKRQNQKGEPRVMDFGTNRVVSTNQMSQDTKEFPRWIKI